MSYYYGSVSSISVLNASILWIGLQELNLIDQRMTSANTKVELEENWGLVSEAKLAWICQGMIIAQI